MSDRLHEIGRNFDRCPLLKKVDGNHQSQLAPVPDHGASLPRKWIADDIDFDSWFQNGFGDERLLRLNQLMNLQQVPVKLLLVADLETVCNLV